MADVLGAVNKVRGTSGDLSVSARLMLKMESLTTELSTLFCAFNCYAWHHARFVGNYIWEHVPASVITRSGDFDAWTGRAVLFNLFTHAHCDPNDEKYGYAVITCFGSFEGGDFVIPEPGLKFRLRPGDVIFLKGAVLRHFVTPWKKVGEDGGRISVVHFNHQSVVDWARRMYEEQGLHPGILELLRVPDRHLPEVMRDSTE